jgi:hypothetical protein
VDGFSTRQAYLDFAASIARRHRTDKPVDDRFLVGDAFLVSRGVIDRIGTIDTRFVGYCGDQDFGLRAKIAGFRVALIRSAFAFHLNHANFSYLPAQEQRKKIDARVARVLAALSTLRAKYAVGQSGSVHDIPWEQLAKQSFDPARHRVEAGDYSRYLLPAHD